MFFFLQISRTELTQGYVPVEIWWAKILIAISVIIEGMRKNLEEVIWKTKQSS
jgi:hypothetical protein